MNRECRGWRSRIKVSQGVKLLVLDVLKPFKPRVPELALRLGSAKSVEGVNILLIEVNQDAENVKIAIEGENISLNHVETALKECGATIKNIDEIVVRK